MATKKTKRNIDQAEVNASLKKPRITEKSARGLETNIYTFDVAPRTTKIEIKKAIEALYGVTPTKVNITIMKQRDVIVRGRKGTKSGGKKAMVYLKKGDSIEFV